MVGDIAAKTTGGQRINAFMVEKIIGSKVINVKGEALGKIEDLVVDIDTGFGMEVQLTVFIDKKEVLPVYLGPAFFILGTEQENYFKLGDEVTVTGSQVTRGDESFMLATTVKRGNEVLRLRDKDGNPAWIGWKKTEFYNDAIQQKVRAGKSGEALFLELALEDLTQAADLFRPISDATGGVDGWVSLEVSPLLAYDTAGSIKEANELHGRAKRPNLFIKIPGTPEGLPAIEETIFKGVPVNVTLLFSREQYLAAAEAYMRGIERRIEAGLGPAVGSVASLFISRWDKAVMEKMIPRTKYRQYGYRCNARREDPAWHPSSGE